MASRRLEDLRPDVMLLAERFLELCADAHIEVLITCTYRSAVEQDALYAQGRTAPGSIVTCAQGGQSNHNHVNDAGHPASQAFDVVVLDHGKCVWSISDPRWLRIGEIGESIGLIWAGRWTKFREYPHFEISN